MVSGRVEAGKLPKGSELPWSRYLVGTVFLSVTAWIVSLLTGRMVEHYRHYRAQLIDCSKSGSGIDDKPIRKISRWAQVLFFIFPVMDLLFRVYIAVEVHF